MQQPCRDQLPPLPRLGWVSGPNTNYDPVEVAALAPEAVRIRTVNGTVGVRGTRFAVRVPETTP